MNEDLLHLTAWFEIFKIKVRFHIIFLETSNHKFQLLWGFVHQQCHTNIKFKLLVSLMTFFEDTLINYKKMSFTEFFEFVTTLKYFNAAQKSKFNYCLTRRWFDDFTFLKIYFFAKDFSELFSSVVLAFKNQT